MRRAAEEVEVVGCVLLEDGVRRKEERADRLGAREQLEGARLAGDGSKTPVKALLLKGEERQRVDVERLKRGEEARVVALDDVALDGRVAFQAVHSISNSQRDREKVEKRCCLMDVKNDGHEVDRLKADMLFDGLWDRLHAVSFEACRDF